MRRPRKQRLSQAEREECVRERAREDGLPLVRTALGLGVLVETYVRDGQQWGYVWHGEGDPCPRLDHKKE